LQIINHLQDCAEDLAELDRCYLPQGLLGRFGASVDDLRRRRETAPLRQVFATLLDRIDQLNLAAAALPHSVRNRRLRLETAVILALAVRLAAKLKANDPLAARVKLDRIDAVLSVVGSVFRL